MDCPEKYRDTDRLARKIIDNHGNFDAVTKLLGTMISVALNTKEDWVRNYIFQRIDDRTDHK